MTARVTAVLARTSGTAACSRCFDTVPITAGAWHAVEHAATHVATCDRCAQRDDPGGHQQLTAWRRAAAGPTTGRRWAA